MNKSSLSKAVNFCNLNSKIALACSSSNDILLAETLKLGLISFIYWVILDLTFHFVANSLDFASAGFFDFFISSIIESILLTAIAKPIRILAFSLALFNLKTVLLVITSFLKSIKWLKPSMLQS